MNSSIRSVSVVNTPPVASFTTSPMSGDTETVFRVDASASSDPENASGPLEVRWDWEDDGQWDTAWTTVKTASHSYGQPGMYTIRLEVRDSAGATNTTASEVVVATGPGGPPEGDVAGLAAYILVALVVAAALFVAIYRLRRRRHTRDVRPDEQ